MRFVLTDCWQAGGGVWWGSADRCRVLSLWLLLTLVLKYNKWGQTWLTSVRVRVVLQTEEPWFSPSPVLHGCRWRPLARGWVWGFDVGKQGRVDKEPCLEIGEQLCSELTTRRTKSTPRVGRETLTSAFHRHFQEWKELVCSGLQGNGAHRSDGGGGRCPLAEARVEVHGEAGSLVTVCDEHHHDFVQLRRHHHDYELWEKPPRAKIATKRRLATTTSSKIQIANGVHGWNEQKLLTSIQMRHFNSSPAGSVCGNKTAQAISQDLFHFSFFKSRRQYNLVSK